MKKVNDCVVENCIPTPSSCVEWNGGSIEYLGICDGDSLNLLLWEIITKLEEIAGSDLSEFDIDSLLEICGQQAPSEVTLISILNLLKNNQVCLKDFINELNDKLNELFTDTAVTIDLKCYENLDNFGNALSITREQLDQLIIDNLCNHKLRIETLEGKVVGLQSQIDNLDIPDMTEQEFETCIDPNVLPASTQIIKIADELCALIEATGDTTDIATALALTPGDLNAEFGLITGWVLAPANWAQNYGNLLLEVENLRQRILNMEENCCGLTCKDIELGFSAIYNEDGDGIIITFSFGAGTDIPPGFTDSGSYGTITDIDGNSVDFNITIANNATEEVVIAGLNTTGPLEINITAILGTETLTCQQCLKRTINRASCDYCQICAVGSEGTVVVIYEDNGGAQGFHSFDPSTTTTTTVAP